MWFEVPGCPSQRNADLSSQLCAHVCSQTAQILRSSTPHRANSSKEHRNALVGLALGTFGLYAGLALLLAVTGFGITTIVFGISRSFPLSLAMLALAGALDNVSVVVRHSLVQLLTPDEMRGRVSAINGMFISISNELGGFESGTAAWLFNSPMLSVVSGGIGTLVVVTVVAWLFPQMRRYGRLDGQM